MFRLFSLLAPFSLGADAVYACSGYGDICPDTGTPQFAQQAAAD